MNDDTRTDRALPPLQPRDFHELRSVRDGLLMNDEKSVRARARLETLGLIVHRGWELTDLGREYVSNG